MGTPDLNGGLTLGDSTLAGTKHPALQGFLSSAFLDASTAMGFLNAPGSLRHHHSDQGGLLEHTAYTLNRIPRFPDYYHPSQERGGYQPHDMAALELLATPLVQLEAEDGSLANRIWGYFKPKHWHPKKSEQVHERVAELDRYSVKASQYLTSSHR